MVGEIVKRFSFLLWPGCWLICLFIGCDRQINDIPAGVRKDGFCFRCLLLCVKKNLHMLYTIYHLIKFFLWLQHSSVSFCNLFVFLVSSIIHHFFLKWFKLYEKSFWSHLFAYENWNFFTHWLLYLWILDVRKWRRYISFCLCFKTFNCTKMA